ncbi:MAG: hypothetical protein VB017_00905 [Endomicrobiaceae bacterium]|nr:hypothetical protein [Endomicrobiaceae bacterium]
MTIIKKILLVFLGIIIALCILEISLQTIALSIKIIKNYEINKELKKKAEITILCLGESTTDGQWPKFLEEELKKKGLKKEVKIIDEGHEASRTNYLVTEIVYKKIDLYKPDIIVSMMGINDHDFLITDINKPKFKILKLFYLVKKHIMSGENLLYAEEKELIKNKYIPGFDILFAKAIEYFHKKQYDEAIEIYRDLNKYYPDRKKDFIIDEILAYKFAKNQGENADKIISEYMKTDKYFAVHEILEMLCRTKNVDKINELFLNGDIIKKYITVFIRFKKDLFNVGALDVVKKIDEQILIILKEPHKFNNMNIINICGFEAVEKLLQRDYKEADKYFELQTEYSMMYETPTTQKNYKILAAICKDKKIKLIAMQYPIRSIQPLKKMLENFNEVVFVSNEIRFKEALKEKGYEKIFRDRFAGDFGHCTDYGNRLIAENVAETIVKIIQ